MPTVRVFATAEAPGAALPRIHRLLEDAFDGEFSDDDWEHTVGGLHVVVTDGGAIVSHAAVVPREIEVAGRPFGSGYVEGVATAPGRRRQGLGSLAMAEATQIVRARFELGVLSTSRRGFYERLGWERWRGPSYVRQGSEMIRTEDEDDGIMVLRCGPSRDIDLTAAISCEQRAGDDW